jgi:UDP-GlcNAc:undecaprenyl-phosphate GlcNAc-1-phosphate transferase
MSQFLDWLQSDGHLLSAILGVCGAFVLSLVLTPLVMAWARSKGLVAKPSADRWHTKPTALFGGIAIFLAAALAALLFLPDKKPFVAIGIGGAWIWAVGVWDDLRPLRPAHKFIAQIVAACGFVAAHYGMASHDAPYNLALLWLMPVAVVWIAGITNAFNLLDNMDGLSAGVATLVALLMAAHAAVVGDTNVALGALIIAGAAGGFLVFNFNPAKVFMGDCGSMFLGYTLSCLTLMSSPRSSDGSDAVMLSSNLFTALLIPTLALATPLFDTTFVSVVRFLNGRPISKGGRDHTSHRLVMLGLSERRAVCYLYGITLWFGCIALWGAVTQSPLATIVVTLLSVIALLVFAVFLAEVQVYSEEEYEAAKMKRRAAGDTTVLSRLAMHKRRFVEAFVDFCLVCACLLAASLLQYEGNMDGHIRALTNCWPYVVAAQMCAFYFMGMYSGVWRYVTISDIGSAVRAVVAGTLTAGIAIALIVPAQSKLAAETLIIDASLLTISAVGVRLGLKALRYHFALKWRDGLKRVLIVGAGDAGELAVREMMQNQSLQLKPVGFLDDDPLKQRARIHGVQVLGSRGSLLEVVRRLAVDEVVIAMPSMSSVTREVANACREANIECREVRGVIL